METKKLEAYVAAANMCKGQADIAQQAMTYSDLADAFERYADALTKYAATIRRASGEMESLIDSINPVNGMYASRIASNAKSVYQDLTTLSQPRYMSPTYLDDSITKLGEGLAAFEVDAESGCSSFHYIAKCKLNGEVSEDNDASSDEDQYI
jgi:ABC-type transporter Mla subunit MlaD